VFEDYFKTLPEIQSKIAYDDSVHAKYRCLMEKRKQGRTVHTCDSMIDNPANILVNQCLNLREYDIKKITQFEFIKTRLEIAAQKIIAPFHFGLNGY